MVEDNAIKIKNRARARVPVFREDHGIAITFPVG